jgi:ERCC4-type nuclease
MATPTHNTGPRSKNELSLPALKSLGELADAKPIIEIDTREQAPLVFTRLQSVRSCLPEADYRIAGVVDWAVERKGSLDELAACCIGSNRDRFERELHRLRPYRFKRLLVVGAICDDDILSHQYQSAINPRCVLGSLYAWQARFDIPFVLTPSAEAAARLIELWAHYHCREAVQSANGLLRGYYRSAKATIGSGGSNLPP